MKKFAIVAAALAVVGMLAAPAMADFTPYMSVRYHTDIVDTDGDTDLNWGLASNSRFGGKFATDDLTGGFEFGTGVNLRLLYGNYKFGEMGTFMIGQHYNVYTNFSDQALNGDQGNVGYGALYDGRKPQVRFTFPFGLSISAIQPSTTGLSVGGRNDTDSFLPKIAVAYNGKFDPVSFGVTGAFNTITQKGTVAGAKWDEELTSYLFAAKIAGMAGPVSLKANAHFGQNLGNFGILDIYPDGSGAGAQSSALAQFNTAQTKVEDTTTIGGYLQAQFDTGMAKIGAGVGYVQHDNKTYKKLDGSSADPDAQATYWINANIPVAKTFFIVPEFSYFDQMDDRNGVEEKDVWRLGAKWQMNL